MKLLSNKKFKTQRSSLVFTLTLLLFMLSGCDSIFKLEKLKSSQFMIAEVTTSSELSIADDTRNTEATAINRCEIEKKEIERNIYKKINLYQNRKVHCPSKVIGSTGGIMAEDHGAFGNGINDDTSALQVALNLAQMTNNYLVLKSNKVYLISNQLFVRPGIKGILSSGKDRATLKTTANFPVHPMLLLNSSSQQKNTSDLLIQNIFLMVMMATLPMVYLVRMGREWGSMIIKLEQKIILAV